MVFHRAINNKLLLKNGQQIQLISGKFNLEEQVGYLLILLKLFVCVTVCMCLCVGVMCVVRVYVCVSLCAAVWLCVRMFIVGQICLRFRLRTKCTRASIRRRTTRALAQWNSIIIRIIITNNESI